MELFNRDQTYPFDVELAASKATITHENHELTFRKHTHPHMYNVIFKFIKHRFICEPSGARRFHAQTPAPIRSMHLTTRPPLDDGGTAGYSNEAAARGVGRLDGLPLIGRSYYLPRAAPHTWPGRADGTQGPYGTTCKRTTAGAEFTDRHRAYQAFCVDCRRRSPWGSRVLNRYEKYYVGQYGALRAGEAKCSAASSRPLL